VPIRASTSSPAAALRWRLFPGHVLINGARRRAASSSPNAPSWVRAQSSLDGDPAACQRSNTARENSARDGASQAWRTSSICSSNMPVGASASIVSRCRVAGAGSARSRPFSRTCGSRTGSAQSPILGTRMGRRPDGPSARRPTTASAAASPYTRPAASTTGSVPSLRAMRCRACSAARRRPLTGPSATGVSGSAAAIRCRSSHSNAIGRADFRRNAQSAISSAISAVRNGSRASPLEAGFRTATRISSGTVSSSYRAASCLATRSTVNRPCGDQSGNKGRTHSSGALVNRCAASQSGSRPAWYSPSLHDQYSCPAG
jgi:hypothetical protein